MAMSKDRALAIYHDWARNGSKLTQTQIARRYHTATGTVHAIITATHTHTRDLPALHTPAKRPTHDQQENAS